MIIEDIDLFQQKEIILIHVTVYDNASKYRQIAIN